MPSESIKTTFNKISRLYTDSLKQYGCSSKSVGWRDAQSHAIRFKKLIEVIDPLEYSNGLTINDYGCGYGAMFRFLAGIKELKFDRYFGYDISPEMINAAKSYIDDERAVWIQDDKIIYTADYTFVSGTFNVRFTEDDKSWRRFILDTVQEMAVRSKRGFAFNLLSTYVEWKEEHLYYGDPLYFFDYCKKNISKYVALLHDYPLFEWTIYVRMQS